MLFKGKHDKQLPLKIFGMVLVLYIGFAICSPKAAFDPMYIYRASTRELSEYMSNEVSLTARIWSNFMSVLSYTLLYSGFPFAPVFLIISFRDLRKYVFFKRNIQILFQYIIPVLILTFFTYNLFASILFVRTFYPFFFLSDIYVAVTVSHWLYSKRKAIALALFLLTVLRGGYLIYLLSDDSDSMRMAQILQDTVDDNYQKTTIIEASLVIPDSSFSPINLNKVPIYDSRFSDAQSVKLEKGELLITGAFLYERMPFKFSFYPSDSATFYGKLLDMSLLDDCSSSGDEKWAVINQVNEEYLVCKLYPEYYYYLFGYFLYGTTDTCYEFPTNYIYYRSN